MARTKQSARGRTSRKQLAPPIDLTEENPSCNEETWSCNEEYSLSVVPTIPKKRKKRWNSTLNKHKSITPDFNIQQTQNKIVPFIKLARKLSHCNPTQLQQFTNEMINIFSKNDKYDVFQNILLNGLKSNYESIPSLIYQEIDKIDITPKLIFNDSFPNLDDEDQDDISMEENKETDATIQNCTYNKNQAFLIKQPPKDILCYTFNFLELSDIFSISKTCRYLCVISYDPDSIYHLKLSGIVDFIHCAKELRYSKIRSLLLTNGYPGWYGCTEKQLNKIVGRWNRLECLNIAGFAQRFRGSKQSVKQKTFKNLIQMFPSNLDLKTLSLDLLHHCNTTSDDALDAIFIENFMNVKALQYLSLSRIKATFHNMKLLIKCRNLKKLSLFHEKNDSAQRTRQRNIQLYPSLYSEQNRKQTQTEDFYKLLASNTKYIGSLYPFPYLQQLEIDCSWLTDTNIDILNWILMNGPEKKKLTLNVDKLATLSQDFKSRFIVSLSHVSELILNITGKPMYILSVYDLCKVKWDCFVLHSKKNIIETKTQKMIDKIVQNSESSSLIYETDNFDVFRKWLHGHYVSGKKFFNGVHLNIYNGETIQNYKGDNSSKFNRRQHKHDSQGTYEENTECLCIARENMQDNISNEFKAIEWFLNRCDNKKKMKEIGIKSFSLDLIHNHKHELKPRDSLHDYVGEVEYWEYDDYSEKKGKEIQDEWDKTVTDASTTIMKQYLTNKFQELSRTKKFQYEYNTKIFRFSHRIDIDSESV